MTTIHTVVRFKGVHFHPCEQEDSAYIVNQHRHVFTACSEVQLLCSDKNLDSDRIRILISECLNNFDTQRGCIVIGVMNCEMIARYIYGHICDNIKEPDKRYLNITVYEDGQNGASVKHFAEGKMNE